MRSVLQRPQLVLLAICLLVIGIAIRVIFPPFGNLLRDLPAGSFTSEDLTAEFVGDPVEAYLDWGNKIIILEGKVAASGKGYAMIGKDMSMVRCQFRRTIYDRRLNLNAGDSVTVKGVCRGLNSGGVLLTQCIILNQSKK